MWFLLPVLVPLPVALLGSAHVVAQDRTPTGRLLPPPQFRIPESNAIDHVNLLIGNDGPTPDLSGGMIPSTGPPYAMTRWIAQTGINYVSQLPYNISEASHAIYGFQATRQPAIWMGETASLAVVPGIAPSGDPMEVKTNFLERGLKFVGGPEKRGGEIISPGYYSVTLEDGFGGRVLVEQSSTSRVGHLRFTFTPASNASIVGAPYILIDAVRQSVRRFDPADIVFPAGNVSILPSNNEICGSSNERQDSIITPNSIKEPASHFKGFFCARLDVPLNVNGGTGIIKGGSLLEGKASSTGSLLSAFAMFPSTQKTAKEFVVNVRVGTSFISEEQARRNIDLEIPNSPIISGQNSVPSSSSLETTAEKVRSEWADKLDRIQIKGATDADLEVFYTSVVHALQYPNEQHEENRYYSAYDNQVHEGPSYTGYSIWDTYRAAWGWTILFAPERVPGMITSMLNDFEQGGWLPMWKNIAETSIMVGTHADSLIGEAFRKNITGFDRDLAWEAVWKDATIPPVGDYDTVYGDRQENVDFEVRAGLSTVYDDPRKGWVANDIHSESASRTLDYAYDDYAVYVVAKSLNKPDNVTSFLLNRSRRNPFTLYNNETNFMEARNANGSLAGPDSGWTEGDKWIYSFDVVHDISQLIQHRGGNVSFAKSLDAHFDGGHNQHSNEPSHHIPYLYSLAGAASRTQERVRAIAAENYGNTPNGLSGNEDCGQMSAWYIFSAMGFYPVNPVSGEYVVGTPFFDEMIIDWPLPNEQSDSRRMTIKAEGAPRKKYVKSVTVNKELARVPILLYEQIIKGGEIVFEMSDNVEQWGNDPEVIEKLG